MKRSFRWVAGVSGMAVALAVAGTAFAAEKATKETKTPEFRGEVTAIDAAGGMVTVKDKDANVTKKFTVPAGTKIYVKGESKSVKLDALKVGEKVKVTWHDDKGTPTADLIGQQGSDPHHKQHMESKKSAGD